MSAVLPSAYRVKLPSASVTTGPREARWSSFFSEVVCCPPFSRKTPHV